MNKFFITTQNSSKVFFFRCCFILIWLAGISAHLDCVARLWMNIFGWLNFHCFYFRWNSGLKGAHNIRLRYFMMMRKMSANSNKFWQNVFMEMETLVIFFFEFEKFQMKMIVIFRWWIFFRHSTINRRVLFRIEKKLKKYSTKKRKRLAHKWIKQRMESKRQNNKNIEIVHYIFLMNK